MLLAGQPLDGAQGRQFRAALNRAFKLNDFEQTLHDSLDKRVEDIIIPRDTSFPRVLDWVIEAAERESWTAQLLQATLSVRPEDKLLLDFAQQFGQVIKTPPLKDLVHKHNLSLQRPINQQIEMYEFDDLIERLYTLAGQVCSIEDIDQNHLGTGFLIGPDIIMTNYHVWESAKTADNFKCRFRSHTPQENPIDHLSLNWKIHISRYNLEEAKPDGRNVIPSPEELDYALLRLARAAGNDDVHHPYHKASLKRGWMRPYFQSYEFQVNSPLYILHYPMQRPITFSPATLKISLESNAIIQENENKTRVKYRTNTDFGSSGAPCFNAKWELVALHHAGDLSNPPKYNQGVPFKAILNLLEKCDIKNIFSDYASLDTDNDSAEEQAHIIHLEAARSVPSLPHQRPAGDEATMDNGAGSPGTIIDFDTHNQQRPNRKTNSTQSLLEQARQRLKDTQQFVSDAYAPFAEGKRLVPTHFREAAQSLTKAEQSIQSLRLSFAEPSLPAVMLRNRIDIIDRINTVVEQIEKHLIPSLNWKQIEDFSPLQTALQDINNLLNEQNNLKK